jgi:hypothetical protein
MDRWNFRKKKKNLAWDVQELGLTIGASYKGRTVSIDARGIVKETMAHFPIK